MSCLYPRFSSRIPHFVCHASLGSIWLWQFLRLSLVSMPLPFWRVLLRCLQNDPQLIFLWCFSHDQMRGMGFEEEAYQGKFSSVQSLSRLWLFATQWTTACQAFLSITNSWSLPKLTSIESVMPSNHLILCHPLLLLPPTPPSIMVFSNESALCVRWPKYWSFSFDISPSSEHPGLISLWIDWLDLLAVQGTVKSLLQHRSSKHQFFGTQLSL